MKKTINIIIGILLLISLASAIELQVGETYQIDLGIPYAYYVIVGNSTPVDVDVVLNGTIASITPNKYMESGSFDIIFYAEEKIREIEVSSGGGGGGKTKYRDRIIYQDKIIKINETEPCPIPLKQPEKRDGGWLLIYLYNYFKFFGVVCFIIVIVAILLYLRGKIIKRKV